MEKLKFQKMWEAADTFVFDIDMGSILPILETLPRIASYADRSWFYFYENGIGAAYYEENEMKKAAEGGLRDFSDSDYREKYFAEVSTLIDEGVIFYQELEGKNLSEVSDGELKELMKKNVQVTISNFGYYLACQPQCVSLIEKRIQERMAEIMSEEKVTEAFALLCISTEPTKIRREENDWLNLLLKIWKEKLKGKAIEDLLKRHHGKYFLLNAAEEHSPWSFEYFFGKYEKEKFLSFKELKERVASLDQSLEKVKSEKSKLIELYSIPQDILDDCDLLAHLGHWRLEMRFVWMPGYYYGKRIVSEIARRFSLDPVLIRFATVSEVLQLFESDLLDDGELKKRKSAFLFEIKDGKSFVIGDEQARGKS